MPEKIPFLDLKEQYLSIKNEVQEAVSKVFEQTAFSSGSFVTEFENNFAEYIGVKNVVGVNNGTSALHLCLLALGIKEGDEIVLPVNTFIATAWAPCYVKAKLIFVDCDSETWNINLEEIENKISSKTKAIIGVHLYGQPCDIVGLKNICTKHNLFFIEDCAQAHGAKCNGKTVGGFGDISAFSFYPGKNLGAFGEAGAVVSNNKIYIDKIRVLINQGSEKKYYHDVIGFNMRMDGVQGAILNVKLKHLSAWTKRRQEIATMYQSGIKNDKIKTQLLQKNAESVFHLFVITSKDRDNLMNYFHEKNIFPGIHYPVPIHLQKAFSYLNHKKRDFPNAEYLSEHCLSLPMFPELKNETVDYVIEQLNNY